MNIKLSCKKIGYPQIFDYKVLPSAKYHLNSTFETLNSKTDSKIKLFLINKFVKPISEFAIKKMPKKYNMNYIVNEQGEKTGSLFYTFQKPSTLNIDYIQIETNAKKSPNKLINTAICMMKQLLFDGKKKQVNAITCLPLNSNQQKLYEKFGLKKDNKSGNMFVDFKDFEIRIQEFLKKYNV